MFFTILSVIVSAIIAFFIGKYIAQQKSWGTKKAELEKDFERINSNLEKDYEIKIEKGHSLLEKIKEENKTQLEKLAKEWQVKYIEDIEELKKLFKDSEKIIRTKSVSSSRRSLVGKFIERFIPFLKKIPYEPSDMHFLGQPIDYIVFQGLHEDKIDRVIFVEIKTGKSKLTKREKSLKETIEKKRVGWKEINIDTDDDKTPDKEMENEDTSIKELYETINQKVSSVKNKIPEIEEDETEEIKEEDGWECEYCGKTFELDEEQEEEIEEEGSMKVECPYCYKMTTCEYKEENQEEEDEEETDFICPECGKEISLEIDEEDDLEEGVEGECPYCGEEVIFYEEDVD